MTELTLQYRAPQEGEANSSKGELRKVIVVDEELPYPPNTGKRIRTYNLISRLARTFRIGFLCHRNIQQDECETALRHFKDLGIECHFISRRLPHQSVLSKGVKYYAQLLLNLVSPRPYLVDKHDSRELREAIEKLDGDEDVDLWHCEWTPYAALFVKSERPWVLSAHNIESQIWKRYVDFESNPIKRWYIRHQYKKFRHFERQAFGRANSSIVVSEEDERTAKAWFGVANINVVPNGVDVDYFRPNEIARNPAELLYLGSLDWRPNLDAVLQLLDVIFPRIAARIPDATLTIVGRKPPTWLTEKIDKLKGVTLHFDVPDVRPHLDRAGMLVVPLRIGGGSRLKILEALSSGCPVISSAVGAEGLELTPGIDFIEAAGVDQFAEVTIKGIQEYPRLTETANAGMKVVREKYAWDQLSQEMAAVWQSQIAKLQETSA